MLHYELEECSLRCSGSLNFLVTHPWSRGIILIRRNDLLICPLITIASLIVSLNKFSYLKYFKLFKWSWSQHLVTFELKCKQNKSTFGQQGRGEDALGILTLILWKGIFNENLITVSRIPIRSLLSLASIRSFLKSCFCVCDVICSIIFNFLLLN